MSGNLPKNFPIRPASAPSPAGAFPKIFTPEMARAAAAPEASGGVQAAGDTAGQPAARAGPEGTRSEIGEHFAQWILRLVEAHRADSSRPRLYAIEFPFTDFEFDVACALAGRLEATLSASDAAIADDEPRAGW